MTDWQARAQKSVKRALCPGAAAIEVKHLTIHIVIARQEQRGLRIILSLSQAFQRQALCHGSHFLWVIAQRFKQHGSAHGARVDDVDPTGVSSVTRL